MSKSNVELIKTGYEAMLRGEDQALYDMLDPEIRLHDRAEAPDPKTYHGYQGVRESLTASTDSFDDLRFEPERFFEREDYVVVELLMVGRGRSSGVPVEDRMAHLWKVRDGRAIELRAFSDVADALEAAGFDRDKA